MIDHMEYSGKSEVFGVEKERGKVEGILAAVYQNVFGQDVYPSLEEKTVNLLFFMIKDHPFADGYKRITASLFSGISGKKSCFAQKRGKGNQRQCSCGNHTGDCRIKTTGKELLDRLVMNFLE